MKIPKFIIYFAEAAVPVFVGLIFYSLFIYSFMKWGLPWEQTSILSTLKQSQSDPTYIAAIETASLPIILPTKNVIYDVFLLSCLCAFPVWLLWQLLRRKIQQSRYGFLLLLISCTICAFESFLFSASLLRDIARQSFKVAEYISFSGPFLASIVLGGLVGFIVCFLGMSLMELYERFYGVW